MPHLFSRLPVLFAAAFLAAGAAPTTRQPAILEVQTPPPETSSSRPGLRRVHPGALLDQLNAPAPRTYRVTWSPGDAGVEAGASLEFEFRQRNRGEPGRLVIPYSSAVRETRTAEFTVGERALREHGPVTGWRVSLLAGGRRLAERSSASPPPRGTP